MRRQLGVVAMSGEYLEFSYLRDNAAEAGLEWHQPVVVRERVPVRDQREVSALVWGVEPPELVFIHGGGQNAHTWDTVALALEMPIVALDLPGHGHSDWVDEDGDGLGPSELAKDVALAINQLAPDARAIVGMSLGGLTSIALTGIAPELVRKLALVDATPGVGERPPSDVVRFLSGQREFETFEALLEYTVTKIPPRALSATRRGVLHNSHQRPDGVWTWRHQARGPRFRTNERAELWDVLEQFRRPTVLFRGGRSPMVSDEDVAELRQRLPAASVVGVPDAGHSIQGDQPVLLAREIQRFLETPDRSGPGGVGD
jgi:pimeloyl-ACP methyl ester carboxylesterase